MGICFSCFSSNRKKKEHRAPYLKPFDSSKVLNANDEDLIATFPESLSDSLEEENQNNGNGIEENKVKYKPEKQENGANALEKVVDTPHLL